MKALTTGPGDAGPPCLQGETTPGGVGGTGAVSRSAAERDPEPCHTSAAELKAEAQRRTAEGVARWRAEDPANRTCSDAIARSLLDMAWAVRRAPEPSLGPPAWWRDKHARTLQAEEKE